MFDREEIHARGTPVCCHLNDGDQGLQDYRLYCKKALICCVASNDEERVLRLSNALCRYFTIFCVIFFVFQATVLWLGLMTSHFLLFGFIEIVHDQFLILQGKAP